ncbi:MFS transporter [Sinanaerobacter sp. ZZT-01]|uniref:MFS transporter n=1 Tax=Sinanaerobacter sp. ZZT-01 TaxID=3111540 RepID=UPI002D7684D4|nr:MFS transporter [Sinanaerobacter sp. ZZT-01]WRR94444.1 MFS transporter [Sinanaerobacter sp. ZZT-01]
MTLTTTNHHRWRNHWNLVLFIFSFVISNLVSGIIYDTYVNYLQEVAVNIATSFWAFYGYATFISAFALFSVPKIGYKKLLLFCSGTCCISLLAVIYLNSSKIFYVTTLLALVGLQLHYTMLSPYIATYTEGMGEARIKWYTRTYYMGYVGYFFATYLGGVFTVKMFSMRADITYSAAKKATEYIAAFTPELKLAYLQGNKDILLITAIISAIAFIPILLIKEQGEDYRINTDKSNPKNLLPRMQEMVQIILKKEAVIYLTYFAMVSFAMGLFSSYFTVYLNRNLHIDKATSSLLVSISYLAIVLFMLFTPFLVRKLGQVNTISTMLIVSIPFMLIIANGEKFGSYKIAFVGVALFMRAGIANISSPADNSLAMSIADKNLRPIFASMVNVIAGLASIVSGLFTGNILFTTQMGYKNAYYLAAGLYFIASIIVAVGLKKYNRIENSAESKEEIKNGE